MGLGEFATLESLTEGGAVEKIVHFFFFIATFFTMLTMLNMLIAIMGDSFDYATENRERFAMKTKLDILGAIAPSLPQTTEQDEENLFMIIASPAEDDECAADESWNGSINKVIYLTKKLMRGLEEDMKKTMER